MYGENFIVIAGQMGWLMVQREGSSEVRLLRLTVEGRRGDSDGLGWRSDHTHDHEGATDVSERTSAKSISRASRPKNLFLTQRERWQKHQPFVEVWDFDCLTSPRDHCHQTSFDCESSPPAESCNWTRAALAVAPERMRWWEKERVSE